MSIIGSVEFSRFLRQPRSCQDVPFVIEPVAQEQKVYDESDYGNDEGQCDDVT